MTFIILALLAAVIAKLKGENAMGWNPLTWFQSEEKAVESAVETDADAAPQKTVTIIHAVLASIEQREAGHPLIVRTVTWIDEMVQKHAAPLIADMEMKALSFLAAKYPPLAPEAQKIVKSLAPTAARPTPATPATPPAAAKTAAS